MSKPKEQQLNFPFHPDEIRKLREKIYEELEEHDLRAWARECCPEIATGPLEDIRYHYSRQGILTAEDYAVTISAR